MTKRFRIAFWLAAGVFVMAVCVVVAKRPDQTHSPAVHATPPEIVISPRPGHYDHRAGHYVWWR
jgi:hypothetical protein